MSLRAKIFSLVGGLFFVAFIASQFFEEYITSKNLHLETQELNHQIIENQESKRQELQRFAHFLIENATSPIAVLLDKVREFAWLNRDFIPSDKNSKASSSWLAACNLVDRNQWIDFIENTADGKIKSLILLDAQSFGVATKIPPKEMPIFMGKGSIRDEKWQGPYIGIPYFMQVLASDSQAGKSSQDQMLFYLLFKPDALMKLDLNQMKAILSSLEKGHYPNDIEHNVDAHLIEVARQLISSIEERQNQFKASPLLYQQLQSGKLPPSVNPALNMSCEKFMSEAETMTPTKVLDLRYDELAMLWQMSVVLAIGIFGDTPFDATFPVGLAQIPEGCTCGQSFMCDRVFYDKTTLTASEYTPVESIYGMAKPYRKILLEDQQQRLFFGGQIEFVDQGNTGELTLGVDAEDVIRELALASSSQTFFVSQGNVIKGFSSIGTELLAEELILPLDKIQNLNSGFFIENGTEFFFMRLVPYPGFDLNFYLVVPKILAFSISTSLKENAKELIRVISVQMQFISLAALVLVLFSLNHIAKHVTNPISHLARACKMLGEGRLDEIHLPKLHRKSRDEVYLLYHSFDEMIAGLKEKEKVQGVLNKVVSPSIAEEILKGKIHLGGEEKEVTVLFADIRHFTKISEMMPPQELIHMLNTCMTKVSHAIDEEGGVIDKYVGDEVMALFGAPIGAPDAPYRAVKCAFAILNVLSDWNYMRQKENLPLIEMGIGIHTGTVIVGNMGAENRLNYTVLGSNVNLASRLCSIAAPGQILISQATLAVPNVKEHFEVISLDKILLKGFKEPMEVFSVIKEIPLSI